MKTIKKMEIEFPIEVMKVVMNSSSLIGLSSISKLNLLEEMFSEILIIFSQTSNSLKTIHYEEK